jgi:hypothetical protein
MEDSKRMLCCRSNKSLTAKLPFAAAVLLQKAQPLRLAKKIPLMAAPNPIEALKKA